MIVTVSTVRTDVASLRRFVRRNLAHGADHVIVFLDAPDPAAERLLAAHPHVTHVVTGDAWWRGRRPTNLNFRQGLNVNAAKAALSVSPGAQWLFHLDSDESLLIDRDRLLALDDDVRAVRLTPLEAVSERRPRRRHRDLYKRPLGEEELELLALLGVLRRPDNLAHFRGHLAGKYGIRPALDVTAATHAPRAVPAGVDLRPLEADWLRMLHHEAVTADDFAAKWERLATSGATPRQRGKRRRVLLAMRALVAADVSERTRARYVRRLYAETSEDDVRTLRELGMLEQVRVDDEVYRPRPPDPAVLATLRRHLAGLADVDKRALVDGDPADVAALLAGVGG